MPRFTAQERRWGTVKKIVESGEKVRGDNVRSDEKIEERTSRDDSERSYLPALQLVENFFALVTKLVRFITASTWPD
jgi:hypothetical protein